MAHDRTMQLSLRLESIAIRSDESGHESSECLHCGAVLDFSQPDPKDPNRLIGSCGDCGHWYLHEWPEGEAEGLMLELPHLSSQRMTLQLLAPPPAEGPSGRSYQAGA